MATITTTLNNNNINNNNNNNNRTDFDLDDIVRCKTSLASTGAGSNSTPGALITHHTETSTLSEEEKKEDDVPLEELHKYGKQERAKILAAGYTKEKWLLDRMSTIVGASLLISWSIQLISRFQRDDVVGAIFAIVFGITMADFISGFVHWTADTWGSVHMPYIGKAFIRPFREHHVDPTAMTKHDFFETNGDNFLGITPVAAYCVWKFYNLSESVLADHYRFDLSMCSLCIFLVLTNQIHKWSHMYYDLPSWVKLLQRSHLILPCKHHRVHHVAPHETYFCITTGWLNWPLEKLRFWGFLEWAIESVTGIPPRQDDARWAGKKVD